MTEKKLDAIIATHKVTLEELSRELATNYETPAQALINRAFAGMGLDRFKGGHDLFERITARRDGIPYEPVPRHLIDRWRRY